MYFYKDGGKQCLDLSGNLILSVNDSYVTARTPSAKPAMIKNGDFVKVHKLTFAEKIRVTWWVFLLVWVGGKSIAQKVKEERSE